VRVSRNGHSFYHKIVYSKKNFVMVYKYCYNCFKTEFILLGVFGLAFSTEWLQILKKVKEFEACCYQKGSMYVWYRGQNNNDKIYKLEAGLFREELESLDQYLALERMAYNLFANMGHQYHGESDWNLLFLMQHHGVKTRLLDWTESFAVALFFATKDWNKQRDARIWMLDPARLNKKAQYEDGKLFVISNEKTYRDRLYEHGFLDHSVALHPVRNNPRIVAQQGVFTLQGNSLVALEDEHDGDLYSDGILGYIDIPPSLYKDVSLYLRSAGINIFTMFPDLSGLADYINMQMKTRPKEILNLYSINTEHESS
jgi:hypothetical protein